MSELVLFAKTIKTIEKAYYSETTEFIAYVPIRVYLGGMEAHKKLTMGGLHQDFGFDEVKECPYLKKLIGMGQNEFSKILSYLVLKKVKIFAAPSAPRIYPSFTVL